MTEWFAQNPWAQWVFGGLGTAIVVGVGGWMFKLFEKQKKERKQEQKGRDTAQQVQVGEARDVTVQFNPKNDDPAPSIQKASLDDVLKYDPKTGALISAVKAGGEVMAGGEIGGITPRNRIIIVIITVIVVILLGAVAFSAFVF